MISFLFAMGKNHVIGKDNAMPWHLPADLAYFKKLTVGHSVIMGRKTFESIGQALPDRRNIVVTTNETFKAEGCEIVHSVREALDLVNGEDEAFVIGGAKLFEAFYPYADRLYVTAIDESFEGDTFFPEIDAERWKQTYIKPGERNEKNPYDYAFLVYDRR
ncbi:MAG TPA: dihydrofolate reductase [Bacillales bacterium]|nr:dihydrofolate reductase [Bacillales bacterium]